MTQVAIKQLTAQDADRVILQRPTQDGDGVKISRIAGQHYNSLLDPFLLIDEINSDDSKDYVGGFPPHPHRGFQTFTYMIEGSFHHQDSMGNQGKVGAGGVQWMSAASGVIHSEMPEPDGKSLHGFQLWINLPAVDKMTAPDYQDIQAEDIATYNVKEGLKVHALAGQLVVEGEQLNGALPLAKSKGTVFSFELKRGTELAIQVPANNNLNVLVFEGAIEGGERGAMLHFAKKESEYELQIKGQSDTTKILLLAGEPIDEPIAQYGPFVMNTMAEIEKALQDYRDGVLVKQAKL